MSPLRGIALKLASVFLFMVMASLIKASSATVPPGEAVFFRSFFAIPVILGWLAWRHDLSTGLKARSMSGHVWRGVIGVAAMGCGFAALGLLPLPEVTAIGYASPLLVVIFAAVLLGEKVRVVRLTAVGIGLVGVLIVLWPRLSVSEGLAGNAALVGVALTLASAALRALAQVHVRRMVASETPSSIVFWFSATAAALSLVTAPFGWVVPDPGVAAMLIGAGLIGGAAQIILTSAYRHSEAALLAPLEYTSILFALLIGYVVFSETPTGAMLLGSAVVILSGVLIIWRERQLGLQRGKARPGMTPQG